MKRLFIYLLILLFIPNFVFADTASSNYQVKNEGAVPSIYEGTSSNYQLNASLEPVTSGDISSGSFSIEQGSPVSDQASDLTSPAEEPSTGGGGPPVIVSEEDVTEEVICLPEMKINVAQEITYKSEINLSGRRFNTNSTVLVNESDINIKYFDTNWLAKISLELGENHFILYERNICGISPKTELIITRRLTGDINTDNKVNDYDLSILAHNWQADWWEADFNEDSIVNELDLSLLVSAWRGDR